MAPLSKEDLGVLMAEYDKLAQEKTSLQPQVTAYEDALAASTQSKRALEKLQSEQKKQELAVEVNKATIRRCTEPSKCDSCMNGCLEKFGSGSPAERAAKAKKDIAAAQARITELKPEVDAAAEKSKKDYEVYRVSEQARSRTAEIDKRMDALFEKAVNEAPSPEVTQISDEKKQLKSDIADVGKKIEEVNACAHQFETARDHGNKAIGIWRELASGAADEAEKPGESESDKAEREMRNAALAAKRNQAAQEADSCLKDFSIGVNSAPTFLEAQTVGFGMTPAPQIKWSGDFGKDVDQMLPIVQLAATQLETGNKLVEPLRSRKQSCEKKMADVEQRLKDAQRRLFEDLHQKAEGNA